MEGLKIGNLKSGRRLKIGNLKSGRALPKEVRVARSFEKYGGDTPVLNIGRRLKIGKNLKIGKKKEGKQWF